MADADLFAPLSSLQWVDREQLKPNDYNPNKVSEENLKLLVQSILTNGWTLPIVVRPDGTIIDGFHRWTVSGREPLLSLLGELPQRMEKDWGGVEDALESLIPLMEGTPHAEEVAAILVAVKDFDMDSMTDKASQLRQKLLRGQA